MIGEIIQFVLQLIGALVVGYAFGFYCIGPVFGRIIDRIRGRTK